MSNILEAFKKKNMDSGCSDAQIESCGRLVTLTENIESEKRSYALNKIKAIDKKVMCSERSSIQIEETGGGIKIAFNAGTYELVKSVIQEFYANDCKQYTYSHIPVFDSRENLVEIKYKVAKGKSQLYTLNMYNTKCSCLVNGKQPHQFTNIDLPNMLTKLQTQLQLCDKTFEGVNENVGRLLQKCQQDLNQSESMKPRKSNEEVEVLISDRPLPEIQAPELTLIESSLPELQLPTQEISNCDDDFDDEFDHFISNDMLVKEAKLDMLIEKVQSLHTCIASIKTELSTHMATTANQFEIINDQLHSIRIQNKVNANSAQDQVECIENTALEMNSKIQNQHETLLRKLNAIQDVIKMLNEKKQKITDKDNLQTERYQNQHPTSISNQTEETLLKQINDNPMHVTKTVETILTEGQNSPPINPRFAVNNTDIVNTATLQQTTPETGTKKALSSPNSRTAPKTMVIGDSILKGINKRGLSENTDVQSLRGAKVKEISYSIRNLNLLGY